MAETPQDYQQCQIKVALMQQDMNNFKAIFDKLDTAIEKIGTVSTDLTRMLAVHDERITVMDEKIDHNKENAKMTQDAFREDIKDLNSRITTVNREVSANIITTETKILESQNALEKKITNKQDEMKEYLIESHKALEARIKILEKWRYVLVGIFIVIGAMITYFSQSHRIAIVPTNQEVLTKP